MSSANIFQAKGIIRSFFTQRCEMCVNIKTNIEISCAKYDNYSYTRHNLMNCSFRKQNKKCAIINENKTIDLTHQLCKQRCRNVVVFTFIQSPWHILLCYVLFVFVIIRRWTYGEYQNFCRFKTCFSDSKSRILSSFFYNLSIPFLRCTYAPV